MYHADIDAAAFTDDRDFTIRNKNTQAGTGFTWKQLNGNLKLNYHYNHVNRYYLDDSTDRGSFSYYSKSNYTGRTHFIEAYENYKWQHIELLAGADYRYNYTDQDFFLVSMFGPYAQPTLKKDANQLSGYSSVVYNNGGWNVEAGGRWNHHSVYGNNFTYTFNPSYLVNHAMKLFGNISSAYKVPSLYQLYDPFAGNTELNPEQSKTLEGGVEYFSTLARLRLTGFSRKTDNAIQYIIINPATYEGHYYNTNRQENYGAEAELSLRKGNWSANVNYTFTKGKVTSSYSESGDKLAADTTYNDLYRVPGHAANAVISYTPVAALSLNTVFRYVGSRLEPVYASAPNTLDGYLTIDLGASYRLNNKFRAFVDLKNITNKQYFDVFGYNSRRFNYSFGLNYQL
jgi:vitamin B12 transporter